MLQTLKRQILQVISKKTGYHILKMNSDPVIDNDERFIRIYKKCKEYTMTSQERMYALYQAVVYVVEAKIPGDFVECGVWRGGSSMLIALTLLELGVNDRRIYLYDTFEGMPMPTDDDRDVGNKTITAMETWKENKKLDHNDWCYASLQEVTRNMHSTHYPSKMISFVQGKVEETIPATIPSLISILRLDTDWYESTKHELIHLYPLISKSGVLIIDDYGAWDGSRKATDEYFSSMPIMLNRIDAHGRLVIKTE